MNYRISLLGVNQPDAFTRMIRFLAAHAGRLTDFAEIARTTGISAGFLFQNLVFLTEAWVVSPTYSDEILVGDCQVKFIPFSRL